LTNILEQGSPNNSFPLHELIAADFRYPGPFIHPGFRIYKDHAVDVQAGVSHPYLEKFHFFNSVWKNELKHLHQLHQDPRMLPYLDNDGSLLVPENRRSDMFFIPMSMADRVIPTLKLLAEHQLMLELGFPLMVQMVWQNTTGTLNGKSIPLATNNSSQRSTYYAADGPYVRNINLCQKKASLGIRNPGHCFQRTSVSYGMYHPIKMGLAGLEEWKKYFDLFSTHQFMTSPDSML
jgi:hypothetical protein